MTWKSSFPIKGEVKLFESKKEALRESRSQPVELNVEYGPDAYEVLSSMFSSVKQKSGLSELTLTETRMAWEFPKEKYFEYEQKDEEWCRRLGIGKEVEQQITYKFPRARILFQGDGLVVFAEPTPIDDWWMK